MPTIYLILSVLGLILPYSQLIPFLSDHGIDVAVFASELFANRISTAFSLDLLVSSVVFWLFLYREGTRLRLKFLWVYVLGNLTIGLSFAFPLFLWVRSQKIAAIQTAPEQQELSEVAT